MAVPFMFGNFTGGLFQGAQSAFSLYSAYQGIQAEDANLAAMRDAQERYKKLKEQADQEEAAGKARPDASVQTGDATVTPAGYAPPGSSAIPGPVSSGRITSAALPAPPGTAPPASPANTPPVEPGLVPTPTGAGAAPAQAPPAARPPARSADDYYPIVPWGSSGPLPPGGSAIPTTEPPYGPMLDPAARFQRQQAGPAAVSPGVQSDVAAHEAAQTPALPAPPSVTQPVGGYFGRGLGPQSPAIPTTQPGGPYTPPAQAAPPGRGAQGPSYPIPPPTYVPPNTPEATPPVGGYFSGQGTQGAIPSGRPGGPYIPPPQAPPVTGPGSQGSPGAAAGATPGGTPGLGGVPQASATPPQGPGFLARTLASINPIGSASAAEAPPASGQLTQQDRVRMGGAAYSDDERKAAGLPPLDPKERADYASPTGGAAPAQGMTTAEPTKPAPNEPPPAPGPVAVPDAKVVPDQKGAAVQSEQTPHVMGAAVNPGPWQRVQRENPEMARMLLDVIRVHGGGPGGVTPEIASVVIQEESHWNPRADASRTPGMGQGKGLGQIEPPTQSDLERAVGRPLDPWNARDNMIMTVEYLKQLGHDYGQGSYAQMLAYMRGTGGVEKANQDWPAYMRSQPLAAKRLQVAFGNDAFNSISSVSFPSRTDSNTKGPYTARDLLAAGQQGPDGTLNYLASYGPQNLPMSARWAASQALMEAAAMAHGRYDMIPTIQEAIAMESHQGALSNLAMMHQAMTNGDMQSAAMYGAKAHAFFPDGSYARFAVDQSGKLWAERFSEGPEHQALGKPIQITAEGVYGQMMAMHSPTVYQKMLQEHQAAVATADLKHAQQKWYEARPEIEGMKQDAAVDRANIRAEAERYKADVTAQSRRDVEAAREDARQTKEASTTALDKDVETKYGDMPPDKNPTQWANESEAYRRLRMSPGQGGANLGGPTAQAYAKGLTDGKGTYSLRHTDKGWGVFDKQGNPVAGLSDEAGAALHALPGMAGSEPLKAPAAGQQHTGITPIGPVGAGAGSMAAMQQGYNQNLAGIPMQTQAA